MPIAAERQDRGARRAAPFGTRVNRRAARGGRPDIGRAPGRPLSRRRRARVSAGPGRPPDRGPSRRAPHTLTATSQICHPAAPHTNLPVPGSCARHGCTGSVTGRHDCTAGACCPAVCLAGPQIFQWRPGRTTLEHNGVRPRRGPSGIIGTRYPRYAPGRRLLPGSRAS